ncbi:hypothetical protein F2Q70_00024737 [Brassica cretica]|uniref:Protein DA1-like domain-containing protein n=1 Tax=Brassica cretica TaxID=69181 RepID=A0A8S9LBR1_BRACR|nr:hypothetical protein F2Q70_00024737 [Brassica cretica]
MDSSSSSSSSSSYGVAHIPTNDAGLIEYRCHPFWNQKYCPSHEYDKTARCCSCERLESWDVRYYTLEDGRSLCLECMETAITDTGDCQPLYHSIRDYYEGMYMKLEQQIPMLLVQREALNDAIVGEKNGYHHMPETRGLCLSEEQTVTSVLKRPRLGAHRLVGMRTQPRKLTRKCEVTAILVLYGLPRLLTGAILAHELMHGWLRLKGYRNLNPEIEEGICQVLSYMWLESEVLSDPLSRNVPSTSSSGATSSSSSSFSNKKGGKSNVEKKLGEFFKHQIAHDASPAYGGGFRAANAAIPTNDAGLIEYRCHPFWNQKYCPSHEYDKTARCCSCERLESWDVRYYTLEDGRSLCLECMETAITDTGDCQPLYHSIRDYYEGMYMKLEQQIPMLLVQREALNDAIVGEKNGYHHMPETRGLCLSEEQTVTSVLKRPRLGAHRLVGMRTQPRKLTRKCEVTAILVLYGLPRLLTGAILAHELMHGWLRLKGYRNLNPEVEEGICQVLSYMWLESEVLSDPLSRNVPSTSSSGATSSSSSSFSNKKGGKSNVEKKLGEFFKHQIAHDASPAYGGGFRAANADPLSRNVPSTSSSGATSSSSSSFSNKKGGKSNVEKKLGEFFKHQIAHDASPAYGGGFRAANAAVSKYGLHRTLDHIRFTGTFPL